VYGHASYGAVYASSNDGTTIHTTTYPKQWALNDVGCNCEIEQWLTLDGAAVKLRVKLAIYGYDSNEIGAALHDEQLPALHLASTLNRLVAYTDTAPFSGGAVATQLGAGSQRTSVTAPESWAALVDASGTGVGVIHPGITRYDYAAGFLAPVAIANLNPGSSSVQTFEGARRPSSSVPPRRFARTPWLIVPTCGRTISSPQTTADSGRAGTPARRARRAAASRRFRGKTRSSSAPTSGSTPATWRRSMCAARGARTTRSPRSSGARPAARSRSSGACASAS